MSFNHSKERVARCAIAAGTLAALVAGTVLTGGAANAAPTASPSTGLGGPTGTLSTALSPITSPTSSVLGSTAGTVTGTTSGVGTTAGVLTGSTATGTDALNGTPITAVVPVSTAPIGVGASVPVSVPVTVDTGNVLGTSSDGSHNTTGSTTSTGPTTSTSTGSTSTSTSTSTTNDSSGSNNSTTSTGPSSTDASQHSTTGPSSTDTSTVSTGGSTTTNSTGGNTSSTNSGGNTSSTTASTSATGPTTTSNSNSNSNTSSTSTSNQSGSTSTPGDLSQVQLVRSSSGVYPNKDGYADAITFDVRPLDANGNPVPVTGKAYIVLAGKIVKTFDIDGSTTTVTWDGLVDGKIVPGAYSFVLDVKSATGAVARSTSAFSVSGKKLKSHSVTVKRTFSSLKKGVALPAVVKKNLAYGAVTVRATLKHGIKKAVRFDITRKGSARHLTVKAGKRASNKVSLPAASTSVKVVVAGKSRKAAVRTASLTYTYRSLG